MPQNNLITIPPIEDLTRREFMFGALGSALLAACRDDEREPKPTVETWSITDDRGVTVTLPRTPERVVASIDCAAALWPFGIRPVAYFGLAFDEAGKPHARAGDVDLSSLESVGEDAIDVERLAEIKPELVIGHMWTRNLINYAEEVEDLVAQVAPIVAISMLNRSVIQVIDRYTELAQTLGAQVDNEYVTSAIAEFEKASDFVRATAKQRELSVMFVNPTPDLMYVAIPQEWPELRLLARLGVNVMDLADEPHGDGYPWYDLRWERAGLYSPDLIMNINASWTNGTNPIWDGLSAVRADQMAGWGPDPFWLLYTYDNYTRILTEFAALLGGAEKLS